MLDLSGKMIGATPPGGTFSGPGVTGNFFDPGAAGLGVHTITYTVTESDGFMTSGTFTITVLTSFVSGPTAIPNPGTVGSPVTFSVAATPDNAIITWNFGDGSLTATGATVTHIYAAEDTYTVAVTIQNAESGGSETETLQETIENTTPTVLTQGSMLFTPKIQVLNMLCILPIPPIKSVGKSVSGNSVTIQVNGLSRKFALTPNGYGVSGTDHAHLVHPANKSIVRLNVNVRGLLKAQLAQGAPQNSAGEPTQVVVFVTYQGVVYTSAQSVTYRTLRIGRFGQ